MTREQRSMRIEFELLDLTAWQQIGQYEYEYNAYCQYTGWYRCVGGQLADGRWPQWNSYTGATR